MFLKKLFGTSSQRYIKKLIPVVDQINDIFQTLESKTDQDLINRTMELKTKVDEARNGAKNKFGKEASRLDLEKKIFYLPLGIISFYLIIEKDLNRRSKRKDILNKVKFFQKNK